MKSGNALREQAFHRHVGHAEAVDMGDGRFQVTVRLSQALVLVRASAAAAGLENGAC